MSDLKIKTLQISGNLSQPNHLQGKLSNIERMNGTLSYSSSFANAYNGEYEAVSKSDAVTILNTKNKLMKDNITIFTIPYWETSNIDGTTVIIGENNNGN